MANGDATNNWLWGIGGSIAGTVVGGLMLRGLGLGAIDARLKNVESNQEEVIKRLSRLEDLAMENKRHNDS